MVGVASGLYSVLPHRANQTIESGGRLIQRLEPCCPRAAYLVVCAHAVPSWPRHGHVSGRAGPFSYRAFYRRARDSPTG